LRSKCGDIAHIKIRNIAEHYQLKYRSEKTHHKHLAIPSQSQEFFLDDMKYGFHFRSICAADILT